MSAPELAACPFCGGEAEIWRANGERTAWIACMGRCSVLVSKEHKTDEEAIAAWNRRSPSPTALDPDMPADELRLHMGELTDQEVLTVRAAIRWANSAHAAQVETLREALQGLRDCIQETRGKNAHDAVEAADAALLIATLKAVEARRD